MKRKVMESELRRRMRDAAFFPEGLATFIEPGQGADSGVSDTLVAIEGILVPIELKRGRSVLSGLRPSQRAWHRTQASNGVRTYGATLTQDCLVLVYRIALTGGIMSELTELLIGTSSLQLFDYSDLRKIIMAHQSNG